MIRRVLLQGSLVVLGTLGLVRCEKLAVSGTNTVSLAPATGPVDAAVVDSGPSVRMLARGVSTFYRWQHTEQGDEAIEHGFSKLHLVVEVREDSQGQRAVFASAVHGDTSIPQQRRMRPVQPTSARWDVPRDGYTKYSMELFGGELRSGEGIRVLLAQSPGERHAVPVESGPNFVRLPPTGNIAGGINSNLGQIDAVVVFIIPVSSRRGGRYLIEAIDLNAEAGGFAANGVMNHNPSDAEIARYVHWMRDRQGMGRDRNPPIAMQPTERA
ncbi:MAG: hypothetical protein Q8Q09_21230 [Deltaproteobacteria bacterium]|nr:hypothetical protein [Deltaproteobacteria bacterium]